MKKLNIKGFGAVEGLLILVIVGMLAFTGWYVVHNKNTTTPVQTTNNAATPTNTTPATKEADPYADWKTYTSENEGLSLKYPSSWKLKTAQSSGGTKGDAMTITSPDGSEIRWDSYLTGIGGACLDGDPHSTITKVKAISAVPNFYAIEYERESSDFETIEVVLSKTEPKLGDSGTCGSGFTLKSKDGKQSMTLHAYAGKGINGAYTAKDKTTIEKIFSTVTY